MRKKKNVGNTTAVTMLSQTAQMWADTLHVRRDHIGVVTLHIVHNSHDAQYQDLGTHVRFHHTNQSWLSDVPTAQAPHDARFALFLRTLNKLDLDDGACAFAIDLTDVGVVGRLSSLCARFPSSIFVASDSSCRRRPTGTGALSTTWDTAPPEATTDLARCHSRRSTGARHGWSRAGS